jgi:hypothetical protein
MEVETDGAMAEASAADPFETIFAKRGEKQHKSGKKKVVSTGTQILSQLIACVVTLLSSVCLFSAKAATKRKVF